MGATWEQRVEEIRHNEAFLDTIETAEKLQAALIYWLF